MTTIDTNDTRFSKAVKIADGAGQWLKCRTPDGRKAYGIPSSRGDGRYYLVSRANCDCEDQVRHPSRPCKHRQAVEIHCARVGCKSEPMPASDTNVGLVNMATRRGVLEMVREPEGDITWRTAAESRLAAKYDDIFKRFDDDGARSVRKESYL